MSGWPIAINTYSYIWRYSALDAISHLADLGYRQFELLVNNPHCWPASISQADRRQIRGVLDSRELEVLILNPPSLDLNLVSAAAEMRRYSIDHYRDVIDLAADIGTPDVLIVPGRIHPLLPAPAASVWMWFQHAMDELTAHADQRGVGLVLENVPATFAPRADDLLGVLQRLGNSRIGIAYDVANAVFVGENPADGIRTLAKHLRMIHLSDTGLSKWAHSPVGTGIVPFAEVAQVLRELDLKIPSALEIISDEADAGIVSSHKALARLGWDTCPVK
ncbi:sugar phosphate isomerase/epimerase [Aureimonas fodinaquatilis]|uniref:Sugar phosphate isomerase/epimerase n=1 Tax=Aureimonas fodinaquatilis TaxID=2565783 RepID=A0A5B0DRS8_9HYPH|nr:sugar phosphate isomerase/epimerase family protein [Aureimonas fodinaquatilis]KAA0969073.1 sugar phosphate isomerase/epimerase [Aureimonas fodinaquatilis]